MRRAALRRLAEIACAGGRCAVAVVTAARGSVPAPVGSFLVVEPDGRTHGTVGGAELEWRARAAALEALTHGSRFHTFDLWLLREEGLALACGGTVEVWAGPADVAPERAREVLESLAQRRPAALLMPGGPEIRVDPPPYVLLCGGGHVHAALAPILTAMDWDHAVADERPEYRGADRFPAARESFAGLPDRTEEFTHVSIAGHHPRFELEAVAAALRSPARWIGLIGSRAKKATFFRALEKRGFAPGELERVQIPIGLEIGARTPAEIAVSIAAALVQSVASSRGVG